MLRLIVISLVALLISAGAYLASLDARTQWFDPAPYLARAGFYDVRILRDEWGMPHIYGKRDADAAFGLAYAHAEDDFRTIQETVFLTRGTLGRVTGEAGARTDYLVQAMGIWDSIRARYDTDIPADTRAVIEAYADGVNLYAAEHPEATLPGLTPVTGADVVAGFAFRTPFFYGFGRTLETLFTSTERPGTTAPGPTGALYPGMDGFNIGSNAAALSPRRTAEGATWLLVNSHQPWVGPVSWYEARIHSDEGWDMTGGVFPGSPFILHGVGPHLGWANTVNLVDLVDVYLLTVNPDNPNQYLFDGEWRDFTRGEARMTVKIWGPITWIVTRETLRSVQGPVLQLPHGTYALRYAGMDEIRQVVQYHRYNKAHDFAAFEAALKMQALPSLNYIYADETGRIAFWHNGTYPKRASGYDWKGLLPGDTSATLWTEFLPYDAVPKIVDPRSGFVANANSTPFLATGPRDQLKESDFAPEMGFDTRLTNRNLRLIELLGNDPEITDEEFIAYKMDVTYAPHSEMGKFVAEVKAMDFSGDPLLQEAQRVLAAWDLRATQDSTATALALMAATPIVVPTLMGKPRGDVRKYLRLAAEQLQAAWGRIDPAWGVVNVMRRGSFSAPLSGAFDTPRAVEYDLNPDFTLKLRADGTLSLNGGDSLIILGAWDQLGRLSVRSIHNFGSATLDETSPHYADQAPLFAHEEWKTVILDEVALMPHVTRAYRPGMSR